MMAAINDHIARGGANTWPDLRYDDWKDTCATLQLWTQVVGKVRLKLAPMVNHWWQVALYVTASGLTTSAMPYQGRFVQIDFDFLAHRLILRSSDGRSEQFALQPVSVADFYAEVMKRLRALGVDIHIWTMPSEIEGAAPFERDREHAAYDGDAAQRFWRQLVQADRVMNAFRGRFLGKCSPVHFFWGSFDLAVTLLRPHCAAAHQPQPQSRRLGDARGLLARGQQLRLLARQWRPRRSGLLRLCLPRARRVR
jgi:hypothetical protein